MMSYSKNNIECQVLASAGEYPGSERPKDEKWKDTHESASSQK